MKDPWKTSIRVLILAWFVVINLFVLIPSFQLLREAESKEGRPMLPEPPEAPQPMAASGVDQSAPTEVQAKQIEALKQSVLLHSQTVQAYKERVTAYNKLVEETGKGCDGCGWSRVEVYRLVVKETLFTLIGATAASLIAFVFVSVGGQVMNNYLQQKSGGAVQELRIL